MSVIQFAFGDRVRRKGCRDIFLVLGQDRNGNIQIAAMNWKTSAKPSDLERA